MQFEKGCIEGVIVTKLEKSVDERGFLLETYRSDLLPETIRPQMSYVSYTEPDVSRGPHEHKEQTDIFAFVGPGNFKIYLYDNRKDSATYNRRMVVFGGIDNPLSILVPPGIVHAYRNISRTERGLVLNYPDRLYAGVKKQEPVDEIRHEDDHDVFYMDFLNF